MNNRFLRCGAAGVAVLSVVFLFGAMRAEAAPSDAAANSPDVGREVKAPNVAKQIKDAKLAGDNAWVLTCCALVLLMTAPGLAMFYGGLVRKKNVLGVMMQCVFLMGMNAVIWATWGYSLAFGGNPADPSFSGWIGNGDYLLMRNVQPQWDPAQGATGAATVPMADDIPRLTHMLFQGMFFIITPALICGAFAERIKFSTLVVFTILWGTLVYCPLAHWVWGQGILCYGAKAAGVFGGGALDFAGGTVVHISSGVSALVCALLIGRRLGYASEPMPPHNLTYTMIGAALLWFGWFGFNAGSALGAGTLASSAFAATHFAAAAGAVAWACMEWLLRGKPSALGACSGAVAGLVCVTPGSGFVQPMSAIAMGAVAGIACYYACTVLKSKFKYDDSLDAFGIHGVGGTLGAILTGVFASRAVNDISGGQPLGLIEGGHVLKGQLIATGVTWLFAIVATFILLKILDATMGLHVSQQQEIQGLDLSQHGEEGYIFI